MNTGKSVFRRQHKRLRQIVTGNDRAVLFRLVEKRNRPLGIGGVVHIKNADNRRIPHRHIITDGQIHTITPSHKNNPIPIVLDCYQYIPKFSDNPVGLVPHDRDKTAEIFSVLCLDGKIV